MGEGPDRATGAGRTPRLSRAQARAYRQIRDLAGRALLPEQLGAGLLAAVDLAIPSDGQNLFGVDPATLLFTRLLAVSQGMLPHALWFLQTIYLHEPVPGLSHPELMRARHPMLVLHPRAETCWGVPPALFATPAAVDRYCTWFAAQDTVGATLRACFGAEGRWLAALSLVRFDAARPFRRSDVAFLRLVAPLLGRALRAAFGRECAALGHGRAAAGAAGVLVLAPGGRVRFCTPAAEAWIDLLLAEEAGGEARLPTAVWSALGALRIRGGGRVAPTVLVPTSAGPLRIEASAADMAGGVAVVLTPERPAAPPELPAAWPLTRQERRVLELVRCGLSNREIARALVVSENTVESHLAGAYDKLDVHSRGQFLARLFRETYWPTLQLPGALPPVREPPGTFTAD